MRAAVLVMYVTTALSPHHPHQQRPFSHLGMAVQAMTLTQQALVLPPSLILWLP
jgi:hypothetical protein